MLSWQSISFFRLIVVQWYSLRANKKPRIGIKIIWKTVTQVALGPPQRNEHDYNDSVLSINKSLIDYKYPLQFSSTRLAMAKTHKHGQSRNSNTQKDVFQQNLWQQNNFSFLFTLSSTIPCCTKSIASKFPEYLYSFFYLVIIVKLLY